MTLEVMMSGKWAFVWTAAGSQCSQCSVTGGLSLTSLRFPTSDTAQAKKRTNVSEIFSLSLHWSLNLLFFFFGLRFVGFYLDFNVSVFF